MPNHRKYSNIIGPLESGRELYTASECGHTVGSPIVKRCRKCYLASCSHLRGGYPWISINGRRVQEHRYLAEKALGRPLKSNEVVHHVDMDKTNNKPGNLVICTKDYHLLLHQRMQLLWAEAYKNAQRFRETA